MRTRNHLWGVVVACWVLGLAGSVPAAPVYWTDWTAASPGGPDTVIGAMAVPGVGPVGVTYTGHCTFAKIDGGSSNYWRPGDTYADGAVVDNGPSLQDIIGLQGGSGMVHTATFSQPVVNPTMAIAGRGWRSPPMYDFDVPFSVIASGPVILHKGPLSGLISRILNLNGRTIQFEGTFTEISWTMRQPEYWQGFTMGVCDVGGEPAPSHAPAPGALLLGSLGAGLVECLRRRRVLRDSDAA